MANDTETHVYGGPDKRDDQAPTTQGMRGEAAATDERPDLRTTVTLGNGKTVEVEDESGIAFAEAEGAGHDPDAGNDADDATDGKPQV